MYVLALSSATELSVVTEGIGLHFVFKKTHVFDGITAEMVVHAHTAASLCPNRTAFLFFFLCVWKQCVSLSSRRAFTSQGVLILESFRSTSAELYSRAEIQ